MKRGTPGHPKTIHLLAALDISLPTALGHLELLWHWTADYSPAGDIGRYTAQQIAVACAWDGDPAVFVAGLLEAGYLDNHPEFGILVHDWPEHADDYVHAKVARRLEIFADGTIPNTRKCNPLEKSRFEEWLKGNSKAIKRRLKGAAKAPLRRSAVAVAVAVPCRSQARPRPEEQTLSTSSTSAPVEFVVEEGAVLPPTAVSTDADGVAARVRQVFEYWQSYMNKPRAKLDVKRQKAIAGRLKDGYTMTDLYRAIEGCKASSFHAGLNDRGKPFQDIELICRDAKHVDDFIEIQKNGEAAPLSPTTVHNARALGLTEFTGAALLQPLAAGPALTKGDS